MRAHVGALRGRDSVNDLTKRQLEVLDVIRRSIATRGYPPTLREIGDEFGIRSTNGVSDHLKALERKGFIRIVAGLSRAITLTNKGLAADEEDPHGEAKAAIPLRERPTPGTWKERKKCLSCFAFTFGEKCGACGRSILDVCPAPLWF